jgi:putative membrane protein
MFIDYITLMLVNVSAGLLLLAIYSVWGLDKPQHSQWSAGFAAVGLVALLAGLHMTLTWPMPKLESVNLSWANVAFGELTVLLGALLLALALATGKNWPLVGIAPLSLVWGLVAAFIGICLIRLNLTATPVLAGTAFICTGIGGVVLTPAFAMTRRPGGALWLRVLAGVLLAVAAMIFLLLGTSGYHMHLVKYSQL